MEKEEKKKEIFDEIEMQINKMDNKAGLLISAVGIVFALTIDLFGIFAQDGFSDGNKWYIVLSYCFASIYIISFVVSMLFFILTIFPRKNKKQKELNNEELHINYYYDLSELQRNNCTDKKNRDKIFNERLDCEMSSGDNLTNQIFTNSDICRKKHDKINLGIKFLIPFACALVGLIVLLIIGV